MKKNLILALLVLLVSTMAMAQEPSNGRGPGRPSKNNPPKIEEMVSDLTTMQKHKLDKVTTTSRKRVEKLQAEKNEIREQVRKLIDQDGDHSDELFPLMDRENQIQAEISKEMYRCRIEIDKILTAKQIQQFRAQFAAKNKKGKGPHSDSENHPHHKGGNHADRNSK